MAHQPANPDSGAECSSCSTVLPKGWENLACPSCALQLAVSVSESGDGARIFGILDQDEVHDFGDYEIGEEIGRGGMGVVYRARQKSLDRDVALKMIISGQLAHDEQIERFRLESSAAARLEHPNIIPVYEVGEVDTIHYYAMRIIEEARSISDLACKGRATLADQKRIAKVMLKVVDATAYAHDRGVLHRDLKPANVLLDQESTPYVTDFGLAKLAEADSALTLSNAIVGSPAYISPEQAQGGAKEATAASDVYGLGAILYELACGQPVFSGESAFDILRKVVEELPLRPQRIKPEIDRDFETIILHCLSKDPSERYRTASELSDELGRFIEGKPILARSRPLAGKVWAWCKRKPVLAGALATAAMALLVGSVGVLWQWSAAVEARESADLARLDSERNLYFSQIRDVVQARQNRDFGWARNLLEKTTPSNGEIDHRGLEWSLLNWLCQGDQLKTIEIPHGESPRSLDWVDDEMMLVGLESGSIQIWNPLESTLTRAIECANPPDGGWHFIKAAPSKRWIALTSPGEIRLIDFVTGETQYQESLVDPDLAWTKDDELSSVRHRKC